jgi:hypothetical protein
MGLQYDKESISASVREGIRGYLFVPFEPTDPPPHSNSILFGTDQRPDDVP